MRHLKSSSFYKNLFFRSKQAQYVLGIYLENKQIQTALLKKEEGVISIEAVKEFPESEDFVKQLYASLPPASQEGLVISTSLSSEHILFRTLSLPLAERRKALAALPFELETLLPFPLEGSASFVHLNPIGKKAFYASIFATSKAALSQHVDHLKSLHFIPDYVGCDPIALYRLSKHLFPEKTTLNIFHFGKTKSCCILISDDQIVMTKTLHIGYLKLLKSPSIEKEKLILKKEIERLFLYLKEKNIAEMGCKTVQFLQGEWTPKHHEEKRKKRALSFAVLSLACALLIGWGGGALLAKKKKALLEQLKTVLPTSISSETPQSFEDWEDLLWKWENSLSQKKLPFPFLPTVPSVADLLAWLSSHPCLATPEGGKKEGISITRLRYHLYKHPILTEKGGSYAVRIELEIKADPPRLAREFHDALLKANPIVDTKKEIKWNSEQNTYWTSFELKPSKREVL
ncbi:MAG: hypothetical protein HYZ48_03240 [Chlamydiales bacterium]|nr:hypothetical protein [Chlamydiales bacterium]